VQIRALTAVAKHDCSRRANNLAWLTRNGESCGGGQQFPAFPLFPANRVRPTGGCGARVFLKNTGGRLMFENQQKDVENLIKSDSEFRSLYQRHKELDGKVRDAELGVLPMDDTTLHNMKKEKLWAKDKLIHMWERHRASAH
jgi:uncharacterized protein YdcH (DUF465 family)